MKVKSPIVVLVAGAALAAGLVAANMGSSSRVVTADVAAVASDVASSTPPTPTPTVTPTPTPTAVAAAAPAAGAVATYAGKVDGGGSLSIVIKGATVIAYLCDGKNEAWLWGTANGNEVSAKNKAGDSLTGTRGGGKVTGSVTVAGTSWSYSTPSVKKPSGLYRATATIRGAKVTGGWVVLPDGRQVGVISRDGVTESAPPIDTTTGEVTVDGTVLTATEPDADDVPAS